MKKVYLTIAALLTWAMTSVAALAVDIIVCHTGKLMTLSGQLLKTV